MDNQNISFNPNNFKKHTKRKWLKIALISFLICVIAGSIIYLNHQKQQQKKSSKEGLTKICNALMKAKNPLQLIKKANQGIQEHPNNLAFSYYLGWGYYHTNQLDSAYKYLTKAFLNEEGEGERYYLIAKIFNQKNELDSAYLYYNLASNTPEPFDSAAYKVALLTRVLKKDIFLQLTQHKNLLEKYPKFRNSVYIQFNLSQIYYFLKQFEKSSDHINKAIEIIPTLGFLYSEKAKIEYILGNNEAACANYNKAISLGEKHESSLKFLYCD